MQMYVFMNLPERVFVRSDAVSCLAVLSVKVRVQTRQGPGSCWRGCSRRPGSRWLPLRCRASCGNCKPRPSIQGKQLGRVGCEGLGRVTGGPRQRRLSPDPASGSPALARSRRMRDGSSTRCQVLSALNPNALTSSF